MIPHVSPAMLQPDFWTNKLERPSAVLLDPGTVSGLNQITREKLPEFVTDLTAYPETLPRQTLLKQIGEYEWGREPRYLDGVLLPDSYCRSLELRMGLETIPAMAQMRYAYTVRRTNVRTVPTEDFVTNRPDDRLLDRCQETALDPAEPLVVLHAGSGQQWYFVQAYNYRGWVNSRDIALTDDRKLWRNYQETNRFLVVTGYKVALGINPVSPDFSQLVFSMGAKIPLAVEDDWGAIDLQTPAGNYVVNLPWRQADGQLAFRLALVPLSADVSAGYLPVTRETVIRQAFKLLGNRYGWGGLFESHDCSALILDVYRSFGIILARNAGEQALGAGSVISLSAGQNENERRETLDRVQPGATLHLPGHVMLYLGKHDSRYYAIHAFGGYGDQSRPQADGSLASVPLYGIVVTDLALPRTTGCSLLNSLEAINQIV
ncbi:SH3 domain-containing protein [Acetonema longum]|uniref:NLP/P60 protein n=1 Tax=Acetonema longum DSM 6540 TaxID=1009370 RepID=F7NEW0_9FIRM|nr:SH3 domain-containing protein [Acetonema longum]EGO65521.1 NLP/P60 protein [Acetonema longum DSM 6540]